MSIITRFPLFFTLILYSVILRFTFFSGESFKAHRLVLAACSSHFSKLFSNSSLNGQLIVILDGTRHQDLQILLQFMYRGVAYLHQDRIESVLRTAEVLQVCFYWTCKTLWKRIASIPRELTLITKRSDNPENPLFMCSPVNIK